MEVGQLKKVIPILFFLLLAIVILETGSPEKNTSNRDLNVILITVDALRPDHLGIYGYQRNTSPNIDKFGNNSIFFKNAISPSGSTQVAMPAVFTSLYPRTDNIVSIRKFRVWHQELSLVKYLNKKGYQTKGIVAIPSLRKELNYGKGFESYNDKIDFSRDYCPPISERFNNLSPGIGTIPCSNEINGRTAKETTNLAVNFFNKTNRNFFLWLHYSDPHSPYMPPKEKYVEMFERDFSGKGLVKNYTIYGHEVPISTEVIYKLKNLYDSEIRYLDLYLGRLFEELKNENLYKNTIIILTADHGECLGEHQVFDHNTLYNCTIKVPLIVRIPGKSSRTIEQPVSTIDVFPTVFDLLNISVERPVRGQSLFSETHRDYQYAEYSKNNYRLIKYTDKNISLRKLRKPLCEKESFQKKNLSQELRQTLRDLGYLR